MNHKERNCLLAILCCFFLLLAGCASQHVLVLKDGRTIETAGNPKFDEKTGFYKYKTLDGKGSKVNKDEIVEIKEN
jgi:hypothetical protein